MGSGERSQTTHTNDWWIKSWSIDQWCALCAGCRFSTTFRFHFLFRLSLSVEIFFPVIEMSVSLASQRRVRERGGKKIIKSCQTITLRFRLYLSTCQSREISHVKLISEFFGNYIFRQVSFDLSLRSHTDTRERERADLGLTNFDDFNWKLRWNLKF